MVTCLGESKKPGYPTDNGFIREFMNCLICGVDQHTSATVIGSFRSGKVCFSSSEDICSDEMSVAPHFYELRVFICEFAYIGGLWFVAIDLLP